MNGTEESGMARRAISAMVVAAVAAALVPLVILTAPSAWACSCGPPPSAASYYRAMDVVFTGRVIAREAVLSPRPDGLVSTGDPLRNVFAVKRIFKGDLDRRTYVITRGDSSNCRADTSGPGPFLVHAKKRGKQLHAALCNGIRPVPKPLPAVLGIGYPPRAATVRPLSERGAVAPWVAGAVAGLVVLSVPGWLVLRVVRRRA